MKYTEKVHAKRLLGMLSKKDPCLCCPAAPRYKVGVESGFALELRFQDKCPVCFGLLGMERIIDSCPCLEFGKEESIKRTWIALEEKGYI
jgi:hypothetical protein